jgi:hypothetical protein
MRWLRQLRAGAACLEVHGQQPQPPARPVTSVKVVEIRA